jgi:hypothetical protein
MAAVPDTLGDETHPPGVTVRVVKSAAWLVIAFGAGDVMEFGPFPVTRVMVQGAAATATPRSFTSADSNLASSTAAPPSSLLKNA